MTAQKASKRKPRTNGANGTKPHDKSNNHIAQAAKARAGISAEISKEKMAQYKAKVGAPSLYTRELATEIVDRVSNGENLAQICRDEHMPARITIWKWESKYKAFGRALVLAREFHSRALADDLLDIADDGHNDWMEREVANGRLERVRDPEAVPRSRLRIQTRQWLLAKHMPEVYGDHVDVQHGGTVNINIGLGPPAEPEQEMIDVTPEE